ncbi:MAG: rod shape-determining protein MreC [Sphaerobacteraceae bacterium]|nr:MAG: rod shape-determining protein MreC [Sphaerobacteraceae bacterium]
MLTVNLRQTIVLIFLFVVVSTGLIVLDSQNRLDWLRSPAGQLFSPIVWVFNQVGSSAGSIGSSNPEGIEAELESVQQERDELLAENAELRLLEEEVQQLRNQLEFQETFPDLEPVPANVISEDPNGIDRVLIIDQGRDAGIRTGMAVVSPEFFVGQVTNVDANRARVTLILDASAQIGGVLQDSGAEGVVYGRWQAGGLIEMRHIDASAEVEEGELVVTSGRTARVPPGLIIGQVSEVELDVQADTQSVRLTPVLDFRSLQSVTVILSDDVQDEVEDVEEDE